MPAFSDDCSTTARCCATNYLAFDTSVWRQSKLKASVRYCITTVQAEDLRCRNSKDTRAGISHPSLALKQSCPEYAKGSRRCEVTAVTIGELSIGRWRPMIHTFMQHPCHLQPERFAMIRNSVVHLSYWLSPSNHLRRVAGWDIRHLLVRDEETLFDFGQSARMRELQSCQASSSVPSTLSPLLLPPRLYLHRYMFLQTMSGFDTITKKAMIISFASTSGCSKE